MRKIMVVVLIVVLAAPCALFASGKKEGSAAGGKIELEALVWKQDSVPTFQAWAKAFNELHPNVTVVYSGIGDYDTQVSARYASGTLPAVIFIPGGNYGFVLPKAGLMMDLTNQKFLDRVKDGILQSERLNGKIYSLPIDLAGQGFIYNKKVFADAGITKVPATWDELYAACDKIKAMGVTPFVVTGGDAWSLGITGMTVATPLVYAKDPDFDMGVINGSKHFTDPAWMHAMDIYSKLLTYSNKDRTDLKVELGYQMVATGKAAMLIQGTWAVTAMVNYNKDVQLGFFPTPSLDGKPGTFILGCDTTVGVNAKHKDKDMALKFIEWLTTEPAVNTWTEMNHIFSAMKGSHMDFDPVALDIQKTLEAGWKPYPLVNHMWFEPNVWMDWSQKLQGYVAGDIPAAEAQKALESSLVEAYKVYQK